jgi:hypothetical protein
VVAFGAASAHGHVTGYGTGGLKMLLTIGYGAVCDLSAALGDRYRDYRSRVPMLVPGLHLRGNHDAPKTATRPIGA